mmetsp:Transcript_44133/g.115982  ORF Transcript_44133/g.115982 Transcript_44133/m.115982 type:complete len:204 (+) Transcript_44133:294-905(+)
MHAVLRLAENVRLRRLQHLIRRLLVALCGQAVEEDGALLARGRHELRIHLVRCEDSGALIGLLLLPHACPYVRIDDVGASNALDRIRNDGRSADTLLSDARNELRVGLVALGACAHEIEGHDARQLEPRVDDIITIADVDHLLALDRPKHLLDRQSVGNDLARVVEVCEPIDDRHAGVLGQLKNVRVRVQPRHDHVVHTRDDA